MNDSDSRYEDLERTDVLPQLGLQSDHETDVAAADSTARLTLSSQLIEARAEVRSEARLSEHAAIPFGSAAHTNSTNGRISSLPAKPSTTDLAADGIRGKIADLEHRLIEAQDRHVELKHNCEQLTRRCSAAEERASKAEAGYIEQSTELHRVNLHTTEAQQRLQEERVRFQAKTVEAERQLVDIRVRGEKRVAALEQLLDEQTSHAANSARAAAEARVEFERARNDLKLSQVSIESLEQRLAEQTQTAADIVSAYSLQTSQVAANAGLMTDIEKNLASMQAEKAASDARIAGLEAQVRSAHEATATLQSEIAVKLRHTAALEQGLVSRDSSIDTFKAQLASNENATAVLVTVKSVLEQRCVELERAVTDATASTARAEQETARLNTALRGNDVRISELAAALRTAELSLKERETAIVQVAGQADATRSEYAQMVERSDALQRRLDDTELQIDGLQTQLLAKTEELSTAEEFVQASHTLQAKLSTELHALEVKATDTREKLEAVMAERNRLEAENQAGRTELSLTQARYKEAAQTVVVVREAIATGEQKYANLERELRAATLRLDAANERIENAATATEEFNAELRQRDNRIAALEQKCAEHANALNAISQDIERVNLANPSERLAAMGYALEALDSAGTIHRISRATTTVGRAATNNVPIDSNSVSRYHARIVVQPEGVWIIDLQSTNGCAVNGRRISRQILCDGDVVMIGHCKFRFAVLGDSLDDQAKDQAPSEAFPLFEQPLLVAKARAADKEAREQRH